MGKFLLAVVVTLAICGFCFNYALDTYFGKDIPWYADCVVGMLCGPITVPAAVVGYVLKTCDVPTPIFCPPEK